MIVTYGLEENQKRSVMILWEGNEVKPVANSRVLLV